eukprot:NODE_3249_length_2066_cov_11.034554.p1 GENE.NODE_3249_length_2066_cov_11.034554~~NODE_3249_length_2066_cov_11.034554.p1  ORF type:complete len:603 (-),score=112.76 NODE_3249_length_2066_cov_11.034554:257-1969(-)
MVETATKTRIASLLRELTAEFEVLMHQTSGLKEENCQCRSGLNATMQSEIVLAESSGMRNEKLPPATVSLAVLAVEDTAPEDSTAIVLNVPRVHEGDPGEIDNCSSDIEFTPDVLRTVSRVTLRETASMRILDSLGPSLLVGQVDSTLRRSHQTRALNNLDHEMRPVKARTCPSLLQFVTSSKFELTFAFLIIANAIIMAVDIQYRSFELADGLANTSSTRITYGPRAKATLNVIAFVFNIIFMVEVMFKAVVMRRLFFRTLWNVFDSILVALWLIDIFIGEFTGMSPTLLRVVRLLRLARLSRMAKTLQTLDSLHVLISSIASCMSVLLWSTLLLSCIFALMSMFMNSMLTPYIEADGEGDLPLATRQELFLYFGSFTRSMYTMFELTTGNFVPVTRLLTESIGESYGAFLFIYRYFVGFAIIKVISAVFMHETFRVAANDDDLMVMQKARIMKQHTERMGRLLDRLATTQNGTINRAEFIALLKDRHLKLWLSSMDIEVENIDLLFSLLDNGTGEITRTELIRGISRLRGPARSIDLVTIAARCEDLRDKVTSIDKKLRATRRITPTL